MVRREKMVFLILLVLAASSFLFTTGQWYTNHTVAVAAEGGTYREGIVGQPRLINPLLATTDTDRTVVTLIFSGLYKYDGNGNITPDLAEDLPQITDEGRTYTVKIKKNAKWQNGSAVTADDVVFTIKTLQDTSYNSPRRSEWLATTAEKIDDQTVVFHLKSTSGPFINNLTLPLISKTVWQNVSPTDFVLSQSNIEAIGSGPYRVKEVKKLPEGTIQSILLESFTDYAGGRAHIDNIRLNFYDNTESVLNAIHGKQIDGFGFSPFDQSVRLDKSNNAFRITSLPLPQYQAVFFNLSNKVFRDIAVRKALQTGTDIQTIIDTVYNGQGRPINGPILKEHVSGIPDATISYNVESAKAQLEAAGWKADPNTKIRSKNGVELSFALATNDFSLNAKTAELLAGQWQQLGAKVTLNILPTHELTENLIRPRSFDALLFAQKLGADPDPFIFWHSSQVQNPGLNLSGYVNARADKLMSDARATTDETVRDEKYIQFQNLIIADSPAIFLVQNMFTYAQDDFIQGVSLKTLSDANLRFYDAPNWYIDTKRIWRKN